jgi:hypothetical protein
MVRSVCQMAAPRLVFDETRAIWQVEYAGMVREHPQYWQALCWHEMACSPTSQRLTRHGPAAGGPIGLLLQPVPGCLFMW